MLLLSDVKPKLWEVRPFSKPKQVCKASLSSSPRAGRNRRWSRTLRWTKPQCEAIHVYDLVFRKAFCRTTTNYNEVVYDDENAVAIGSSDGRSGYSYIKNITDEDGSDQELSGLTHAYEGV